MSTTDFTPQEPYRVETLDGERAIVRFAPRCDHPRTKRREDELADLVETHSHLACDLSETRVMASDWLRWLARLSARARASGKVLGVVGIGGALERTTDVLGLGDAFTRAATIEEVWAL